MTVMLLLMLMMTTAVKVLWLHCPDAGFFNYIADASIFNLPSTEHNPQMPSGDYNMVGGPCLPVLVCP
jgi:hypothetical protein